MNTGVSSESDYLHHQNTSLGVGKLFRAVFKIHNKKSNFTWSQTVSLKSLGLYCHITTAHRRKSINASTSSHIYTSSAHPEEYECIIQYILIFSIWCRCKGFKIESETVSAFHSIANKVLESLSKSCFNHYTKWQSSNVIILEGRLPTDN